MSRGLSSTIDRLREPPHTSVRGSMVRPPETELCSSERTQKNSPDSSRQHRNRMSGPASLSRATIAHPNSLQREITAGDRRKIKAPPTAPIAEATMVPLRLRRPPARSSNPRLTPCTGRRPVAAQYTERVERKPNPAREHPRLRLDRQSYVPEQIIRQTGQHAGSYAQRRTKAIAVLKTTPPA